MSFCRQSDPSGPETPTMTSVSVPEQSLCSAGNGREIQPGLVLPVSSQPGALGKGRPTPWASSGAAAAKRGHAAVVHRARGHHFPCTALGWLATKDVSAAASKATGAFISILPTALSKRNENLLPHMSAQWPVLHLLGEMPGKYTMKST